MNDNVIGDVMKAASALPEAADGLRSKVLASFVGFPEVGKQRDPSPEIKFEILLRGPASVDQFPEKEVDPPRLTHRMLAKLLPKNTAGWHVVHASGDRVIQEFGGYMWRRHVLIVGRDGAAEELEDVNEMKS
jgi:hypothetical protein